MTSPFAEIGAAVLAAGYSPIPIMPGDKAPAMWAAGAWRHMRGWSKFCEAPPSAFQVKLWSSWEGAGIGVACGRGLIAYDIDRDELVEPIRAVLPPAVVAKRGRKGETLFFRGDCDLIRSRGFKIDGFGVLDLISHGKQTVIPPSLHMVTGGPYVWTTPATLADTPIAALTEVTIEHHEAVIEVLKAFGYAPEPEITAGLGDGEGDSQTEFFRRLNEDALANLGAWVPRLGLTRLVRQGGGGFRSVAEWRPSNSGNPVHKRPLLLNIHPNGIMDHGDGDKPYTPLNMVIAFFNLGEANLDRAAVWLGECLGYDFKPKIVLNRNRDRQAVPAPERPVEPSPEVEAAARAYREASGGQVDAVDEQPDPFADFNLPDRPAPARPKPAPAAEPTAPNVVPLHPAPAKTVVSFTAAVEPWTRVPGLVGEIVDWMVDTSANPCRALAFAAALPLVGTMAGRNYKSATNNRTNVYTLGLAVSGFGKDHAREAIKHLLTKAGLMQYMGGSKIMSGSAMRKRVEAQASIMWSVDEFGGFNRTINNKKDPHSFQIRDYLLEYYMASSTSFSGADYAGEQGAVTYNPNVSLYGVSNPRDYWDSITSLSVKDGFVGRFMIFPVDGPLPPDVEPRLSVEDPPQRLVDGLRGLVIPKVGGNLNGRAFDGSTTSDALLVPWADAATSALWHEMRATYKTEAGRDPDHEALWNRTAQNAQKIALIVAIGVDAKRPVITRELLTIGRNVAELCTRAAIEQIAGRVADSDAQREHLDVKRWIIEAGPAGITRTALSRKINGRFNVRRLDEILAYLREVSREITIEMRSTGGRPGARLVSVKYGLDENAHEVGQEGA